MANEKKENFAAVVTACALYTFRTGTDAVAIQVRATENLTTGEKVDRVFVGYLNLTARAIDNTIKALREAFGYNQNSFLPLNNSATLAGKECEITVIYEDYQGELRPKVQYFNAAGSFMGRKIKPLDEASAQAIGARFDVYFMAGGSAAVNNAAYGSGRANTNSFAINSNAAEEDLPF